MSDTEFLIGATSDSGWKVDLSADKHGNLYVNDKEVRTKVKLDWLVLVPAWMAGFGSCTIALFAGLNFFLR